MLGEIDGVDGKLPNRSPCIAGKTFNKVTFNQKKLISASWKRPFKAKDSQCFKDVIDKNLLTKTVFYVL